MFWIVIGLLAAAAAWFFLKQRGAPDAAPARHTHLPAAAPAHQAAPKASWGKRVVIPAGAQACAPVRAVEGACYGNDALPVLPLPGCTNSFDCRCHFETLTEKRSHTERRSGVERRPDMRYDMNKTQRREGCDRRAENFNPFNSKELD